MNDDIVRLFVERLTNDYLTTSGWLQSIRQRASVDSEGPVPWFTYPAIRYLSRIVRSEYRVLEYGTGNSALWWSPRVAEVVSVEHDPEWADLVRKCALSNVRLIERNMGDRIDYQYSEIIIREFSSLSLNAKESPDPTRNYRAGLLDWGFQSYASVALEYPRAYFDIIVIDGMARVLTTLIAARQVSPKGMIVFDNSDREGYGEATRFLEESGFRRIDFFGFSPINCYESCTSIFVKTLDALGINDRPYKFTWPRTY